MTKAPRRSPRSTRNLDITIVCGIEYSLDAEALLASQKIIPMHAQEVERGQRTVPLSMVDDGSSFSNVSLRTSFC